MYIPAAHVFPSRLVSPSDAKQQGAGLRKPGRWIRWIPMAIETKHV